MLEISVKSPSTIRIRHHAGILRIGLTYGDFSIMA